MLNHLRKQDMFGYTAELKYNSCQSHKSVAGGVVSVLVKALVGFYAVIKVIDLVSGSRTCMQTYS